MLEYMIFMRFSMCLYQSVSLKIERNYSLINEKNIDELFRFLDIYKESLSDDEEIENAEKLITYFKRNKVGLLPYQARGYHLPKHPKGLVYRNMGTMENHIWSTIARRMKHNHTCWSKNGANHLSKILAKKCSGRLNEVTEKLKAPEFDGIKAREIESRKRINLLSQDANEY